jgi:hypothetical protein
LNWHRTVQGQLQGGRAVAGNRGVSGKGVVRHRVQAWPGDAAAQRHSTGPSAPHHGQEQCSMNPLHGLTRSSSGPASKWCRPQLCSRNQKMPKPAMGWCCGKGQAGALPHVAAPAGCAGCREARKKESRISAADNSSSRSLWYLCWGKPNAAEVGFRGVGRVRCSCSKPASHKQREASCPVCCTGPARQLDHHRCTHRRAWMK